MRRKSACILSCLVILASAVSAEPYWQQLTPGNPPLSLAVLPDITGDCRSDLVAGYDSGLIACLDTQTSSPPQILWSANLNGSILDLQVMSDANSDGFPEIAAATDTGLVACLSAGGPSAGAIRWSFHSSFNISKVVVLEDSNGDGIEEVAFGGADHRVHFLNGANGRELWCRFLNLPGDFTYVDCLSNAQDLNGDGISDLFVRTWGASRWAISGADGTDIWTPIPGDPYLSLIASAGDVNGDGLNDFLESGNDGVLLLCSGKDGAGIWRCKLGRPVRAVAIPDTTAGEPGFECYAGNAEGKIARIVGATSATVTVRWTADVGDVCRSLACPGDIDRDGTPDVIAGAENGVVAAFSGATGNQLWQWQGPDVVRTLACIAKPYRGGVDDIAAATLNGALTLLPGNPAESPEAVATSKPGRTKIAEKSRLKQRTAPPSKDVSEVPILLYHDVPPLGLNPADSSPLTNFREQMDLLVAGGYAPVSLDDIAGWIEGKNGLPAKPVCITLDGQYASHDTHLYEILKDRGLFAISYITTDWIGSPNHLDWHELRRLERSGVVSIEDHTINHPSLADVPKEEVLRQVAGSNRAILRHLDGKVSKHHAYPHGFNNATAREVMREFGFRTATSVEHRRATRADDLFRLPRYTIAEDMPLAVFKAVIGYKPLTYPALPYKFAGTVGNNWRQPSYGDVDAEGKLWICDFSANHVRVFLPDGNEASFSPVSYGIDERGTSIPTRAPSGIAVSPSGEVLVSIASRFGAIRHTGLFRFGALDGKPLRGFDMDYPPGDVDTDARGNIFVVNKITGQWHVYTPEGARVAGSPFGRNEGFQIFRGLTVTPDGSRVYLIGEMAREVRIWKGSVTAELARYQPAGILVDRLSAENGGVDVMDDGTVFVSGNDEGMVMAFDPQHRMTGQIGGGSVPSLSGPRGVAFLPDGRTLWVMSRYGQVQRWEKTNAP